ncbi:MAG: hypothetical protein OXC66_11695 [Roseovarius sp.]|nr:hypothetical protein [Roseovarius sp.]
MAETPSTGRFRLAHGACRLATGKPDCNWTGGAFLGAGIIPPHVCWLSQTSPRARRLSGRHGLERHRMEEFLAFLDRVAEWIDPTGRRSTTPSTKWRHASRPGFANGSSIIPTERSTSTETSASG